MKLIDAQQRDVQLLTSIVFDDGTLEALFPDHFNDM
jgi:hypothetical protein